MNRKNIINDKYAQYKGNKLEVVLIFNKLNLNEKLDEIIDIFYKTQRKYKIGHIIQNEIYFYKLIMQVYLYELNYDYCYYENILKYKLDGEFRLYQPNGQINKIINYKNGKLEGEYIVYSENKEIIYMCKYISGFRIKKIEI